MKSKQSIFLVLMIFAFIAAMGGCAKKNVPPPPGYGAPGQEYGAPAGMTSFWWFPPLDGAWGLRV